jgi:hypothetical protein
MGIHLNARRNSRQIDAYDQLNGRYAEDYLEHSFEELASDSWICFHIRIRIAIALTSIHSG